MPKLIKTNSKAFRNLLLAGSMMAVAGAGVAPSWASSHREAPAITETPKVDGTDFYMFRSYEPGREGFVTFIANYQPLQAPYGGPNYFTMDPDAIYEIHIDSDGDAVEDITYSFDFDNSLVNDGQGVTLDIGDETVPIPLRYAGPVTAGDSSNLAENETYQLTVIEGDRKSGTRTTIDQTFVKPLDNVGNKTLPDYEAYADQYMYDVTLPGCSTAGRVFVGQRADAFAVNLGEVFDLVNLVPLEGSIEQSEANNELSDSNVTTFALEVPIECVTGNGNGVIGAWTTASLPQASLKDPTPTYEDPSLQGGAYVQVSRLSAPLVNEIVIGLPTKDLFNASEPKDDAQAAVFVTNPTFPALIDILFRDALGADGNIAPSNIPRTDLVAAFLTGFPNVNQQATVTASEMMRLNTAIAATPQAAQSNLGVAGDDLAGFPNGRRPGDDVVDIELRVAMGALCYEIPVNGTPTNLGYCMPEDAPVGDEPFTDGAPVTAMDVQNEFPYLNTPYPGSPTDAGGEG
ncbi:DUF4331 domain-containing protein [Litorimonas haliclonae]|uniref:DUF4331 domain-containing protein n=1 Tax=Litorimonas haliclonae TaxID=2081977 RepID=UPI0039EEEA37